MTDEHFFQCPHCWEEISMIIDKSVYQEILDHLEIQKDKFAIQPLEVKSTEEDIEAGAPESFKVPITFDQSNFFA